MSKEIWVQHSFLVQATPARAKKPHWFPYRTETPVMVADVPAFEVEKALVLGHDREIKSSGFKHASWARPAPPPKTRKKVWTAGNRSIGPSETERMERVSEWFGGHEGRLYRPLRAPDDRNAGLTVDRLLRGSADEQFRDHPFLSWRARKGFARLQERDAAANSRMRNIHVDLEDSSRAQVARVASDLLVVDGALWQAQPFAIVVSLVDEDRGPEVRLSVERPNHWTTRSGIHFPIDRMAEAKDFAASLHASLSTEEGARPRTLNVDARSVDAVDTRFASVDIPSLTARALMNATHAAAAKQVELRTAAMPVASAMVESLGGKRPYQSLHLAGNPFDFADRIMDWGDEALTLPVDSSWQAPQLKAFAAQLRDLALPIIHGRNLGLSAESDAAFFNEEDLAGFTLFDDAESDAFSM